VFLLPESSPLAWVHAGRTPGGYRNHWYSGGPATARDPGGAGSGPARVMHEQHETQFGLAVHNFHDTFGVIPAGAFPDRPSNSQTPAAQWMYSRFSGWVVLMPYLEQQALHDSFNIFADYGHADNIPQEPLALFFCPSRRRPERVPGANGQARGDYAFCGGGAMPNGSRSHVHADMSNTLSNGMFVMPRLEPGNRIWRSQGQLSFAAVTDGLSNTIAIGEKRVEEFRNASGALIDGVTVGNADGPQYRWGFHSARNTTSPMNGPIVGVWDNYDANFASKHPGGAISSSGTVRSVSSPRTLTGTSTTSLRPATAASLWHCHSGCHHRVRSAPNLPSMLAAHYLSQGANR
jgi:hypothetical protein